MAHPGGACALPHSTDPALYRLLVEQAAEAIIFIDCDGRILIWNRGACLLFGYSAPEAMEAGLDAIIPERLREAHWSGFHSAIVAGRTRHGDKVLTTRAVHKKGHRLYVDLSFRIVLHDDGSVLGALAIGRDCTERYLAEKERGHPRTPA